MKKTIKKIIVERDSYFDSVFLMLINRDVKKIIGVKDAVVSMGTEVNRQLLKEIGFSASAIDDSSPNDLIIAVQAEDNDTANKAVQSARDLLNKKKSGTVEQGGYKPVSLDTAVNMLPEANLVIISVPGIYAAKEVRKALDKGLHVMLFSDNVSLEHEIELKKFANEKGLLMMGPDCGTAIINGKPLCFANKVNRGDIGIAAASGTGLQEVTCCIDNLGSGISQAIGTGGRDLKNAQVGGIMMLMGIEALKQDPQTSVIVVVSKPPDGRVADKVISRLNASGKNCVVHFIGLKAQQGSERLHFAGNLEEAAGMAAALSKGRLYEPHIFDASEDEIERICKRETDKMASEQKFLRGLYTGGTLADEALILFEREIGGIYSNNRINPELLLKNPDISKGHTIVDLGDDVFTVGRPHPMIDPSIREERIIEEMKDPEAALILLDIVLGYGSHEDPAGSILSSLKKAKKNAEHRGAYLSVITSITGTGADFQGMEDQKKKLESIGCIVMPSNFQASMLALKIIEEAAIHGG